MYRLFWLAFALVTSGCSLLPQGSEVSVRMPFLDRYELSHFQNNAAFPHLSDISQYAFLAASAYENSAAISNLGKACVTKPRLFSHWERNEEYGHNVKGAFPETPRGLRKIGGIGYQLWEDKRSYGKRKRLALVFRGTDIEDLGDWYSNARWITRFNRRTWDQYNQTVSLIKLLKSKLVSDYGPDFELISVGHSLGGGLAQQAAYSWDRIKLTYAFATSPVTGSTGTAATVKNLKNRTGLKIVRVHEAGEILSVPRTVFRAFLPLSKKDPEITEMRFNFRSSLGVVNMGGGLIKQHGIEQFGCDIACRVESGRGPEYCRTQK